MARPGAMQYIDTRGGGETRTGALIDAAGMAASAWASHQKRQQEEDDAVKWLVPYISNLGPKERGPLMVKLSAENPRLFARVAGQIGNAAVDPAEKQQQDLTDQLTGYNRNTQISMERAAPPPPEPGPLGMLGGAPQINNPLGAMPPAAPYDPNQAKAPIPPGYGPLPTDPYARASMMTYRAAAAFGDKAMAPNMTDMNLGSVLPSKEQPNALRVGLKTQAEQNVVEKEVGANLRNKRTADASRYATDQRARTAADREARLTSQPKASTDPRRVEMKDLEKQMMANNEKIMKNNLAFSKDIATESEKAALRQENLDRIAHNKQIKARYDELKNGAAPTVTATKKKDSLGIL